MRSSKKTLETKENLKKGIEILGGVNLLEKDIEETIIEAFLFNEGKISINNLEYTGDEILKQKLQFEKYLILNKKKYVEKIKYKIKQYDKNLESRIKSFKKSQSIEDYNKIVEDIISTYKFDIDSYLLNKIENKIDNENYYGEYLNLKRDSFIKEILYKLNVI